MRRLLLVCLLAPVFAAGPAAADCVPVGNAVACVEAVGGGAQVRTWGVNYDVATRTTGWDGRAWAGATGASANLDAYNTNTDLVSVDGAAAPGGARLDAWSKHGHHGASAKPTQACWATPQHGHCVGR